MNEFNENGTNDLSPEAMTEETAATDDVGAPREPEPKRAEETPEDSVSVLEEKLKATHERLLRTAADLDNFRKRSKRDVEDAFARGRADVLQEILPVLDSIDLALAHKETDGANESIFEGVQMIRKQFLSAAERFGLKEVESRGKSFDPNFHEAVAHVASPDCPAGQIVDEMRKGYMLGEKLLRAAMVVVSKGSPSSDTGSGGDGGDSTSSSGAASETQGKVDGTL